jgi:hypothetical protein
MYDVVNVLVHLIGIALVVYSFVSDTGYNNPRELSFKTIILLVGLGMIGLWGIFIGVIDNVKSLFALVW